LFPDIDTVVVDEVGIYSKKGTADTSETKWMLGPGFRMTLLVTIFLVLINIHNTIQTNSPKVSTNRKKFQRWASS
jgi:hypothetical protein